MSFVRGGNALDTLGIGRSQLIKKWLEEHGAKKYEMTPNQVTINSADLDVFIRDRNNGYLESLTIPLDVLSYVINNVDVSDVNLYDLKFDRNVVYLLLRVDYMYLPKILELFPTQRKKIFSAAKNAADRNEDFKQYLIDNYPEDIKRYTAHFYGTHNTRPEDLKKKLSRMTPAQQLEKSIHMNYVKGVKDALEAGANPHIQYNKYLDWAIGHDEYDIVKMMLQDDRLLKNLEESDIRFFMRLIRKNDVKMAKIMAPTFLKYLRHKFGPQQEKLYKEFAKKNNLR
jgi:hypothetical protein